MSRSPVREAVLELQRDGFVVNPFHRSASIAPFDASVIEDTFDLYGLLWSRATAAVAKLGSENPLIAEMRRPIEAMQKFTSSVDVDAAAYQYRRSISHQGGTQRLRALLRSFRSFVPASYRRAMPALARSLQEGLTAEFAEIAGGNPDGVAAITRQLYLSQSAIVIADLRRKHVIE